MGLQAASVNKYFFARDKFCRKCVFGAVSREPCFFLAQD